MITRAYRWLVDRWYFLATFFPVQLFFLHLRRSHLVVIFWLLLFGFVSGFVGKQYGFQYLFLSPEYLEKVGFLSFFLVGLALGLFIMAFHISSYIYYSYRYPFLATLNRPLWKFSLNNSLLPLIFIIYLCYKIAGFLSLQGYEAVRIALYIAGLNLGVIVLIFITFSYFLTTIKTLEEPYEKVVGMSGKLKNLLQMINPRRQSKKREEARKGNTVNFYLRNPVRISLTRDVGHYGRNRLLQTIQQHHFSAAIYFLVLILLIIALGLVSDNPVFIIPAGGSVFLILSLYLMITGAFYSRLKTWTVSVGILIVIVLNYVSSLEPFQTKHYAYGMDYKVEPAPYNYSSLDSLTTDSIVAHDLEHSRKQLENWRAKFPSWQKPRMIILNVSGGGLRSTLWTMKVLQSLDTLSNGDFMKNCHLITGSSGGMLGAAYYRQLYYLHRNGKLSAPAHSSTFIENSAKDILNPVTFNLAVNDLFFSLRRIQEEGYSYPKDRGYSFDRKWNKNTLGILDKNFGAFAEAEYNSEMPTMILAPTIVGDGRKLLMANQPVSYLCYTEPYQGIGRQKEYDGVEYRRFFEKQNADGLNFITALRMSASFPYITPLVNLPSEPSMELIDAGVRDNEGLELALRYVYQHEEWLKRHTSGVVIVQAKANRPDQIPIEEESLSKFDEISRPIGGVVQSFHNLQIYNKSLLMQLSKEYLDVNIDVVRFSLFEEKDNVSLSWHLTEREKRSIKSSMSKDMNEKALLRMQQYFPQ